MPVFWQWFSFILGLVAFLMAFPFVLQLFFAQPKIGLSFSHDDTGGQGRVMKIHLMNLPINNSILRFFRVSRLPAQDLYLNVKVFDYTSKQIVADNFMPEIQVSSNDRDNAQRINLPSSLLLVNVRLVKWQTHTNNAILTRGNKPIILKEGVYLFVFRIGINEKLNSFNKQALLYIGKSESDMRWDESISDAIFV